jgi:hypothetical protein
MQVNSLCESRRDTAFAGDKMPLAGGFMATAPLGAMVAQCAMQQCRENEYKIITIGDGLYPPVVWPDNDGPDAGRRLRHCRST